MGLVDLNEGKHKYEPSVIILVSRGLDRAGSFLATYSECDERLNILI